MVVGVSGGLCVALFLCVAPPRFFFSSFGGFPEERAKKNRGVGVAPSGVRVLMERVAQRVGNGWGRALRTPFGFVGLCLIHSRSR